MSEVLVLTPRVNAPGTGTGLVLINILVKKDDRLIWEAYQHKGPPPFKKLTSWSKSDFLDATRSLGFNGSVAGEFRVVFWVTDTAEVLVCVEHYDVPNYLFGTNYGWDDDMVVPYQKGFIRADMSSTSAGKGGQTEIYYYGKSPTKQQYSVLERIAIINEATLIADHCKFSDNDYVEDYRVMYKPPQTSNASQRSRSQPIHKDSTELRAKERFLKTEGD